MRYPPDSDLSSGYPYPPFVQLGPDLCVPSSFNLVFILLCMSSDWNSCQPIKTFLLVCQALVARDDLVITTSWDETIRLWNVTAGACLLTLRGHTEGK